MGAWMSIVSLENTKQTVSFKNEQLSCTFLKIDELNIDKVKYELNDLSLRAPNLLNSLPLILDCSFKCDSDTAVIEKFLHEINQMPVNIVGMINNEKIVGANIPWPTIVNSKPTKAKTISDLKTKRIETRVRSGESIEANDAHLVILGSVGSGAEVYATGNIYIFGQLSGKAFAGINGATDACIICQKLNAELIAIAGIYSLSDNTQSNILGNTKVVLEETTLKYLELK